MIAAAAAVVLAVAALPLFDMSAVPSIKDRHVLVHLDAQPGTSQPQMTELTRTVSGQLRALKGVEGVAAHVGRAVTGDQLVDVNSSEVWVAIEPDADYGATLDDIRTSSAGWTPSAATSSRTPISGYATSAPCATVRTTPPAASTS